MAELARTKVRFGALALLIVPFIACALTASCVGTAPPYAYTVKSSGRSIPIPVHGAALGDPKAPVVIEEYSDFQCPFCKEYAEKIEARILEQYVVSGKVQIIYHTFGNWVSRKAEGNTESELTAEAAHFAADHDRFWQLHDLFFALQGRPNSGVFSNEAIAAAAVQVGLDGQIMTHELAIHTYAARVQNEYDQGIARGVTSTPTFFVNGEMIVGAKTYEVFKKAVDDSLRAIGESTTPSRY
jgi:protein-disulfide isomerase